MSKRAKVIRARITAKDIASGVAGNCHSCPVAISLDRATGDTEAMVYERDWQMHLRVHGRVILAPYEVAKFVRDFDDMPRTDDGRIDTTAEAYGDRPKPFAFILPSLDDPEWKEECYGCEQLFDASELDDEGYCGECLKGSESEL